MFRKSSKNWDTEATKQFYSLPKDFRDDWGSLRARTLE